MPISDEVLLGHTHALLGVRVREHPWELLHKLWVCRYTGRAFGQSSYWSSKWILAWVSTHGRAWGPSPAALNIMHLIHTKSFKMLLEIVVVYFGGLEFGMDKNKDSSDYCPQNPTNLNKEQQKMLSAPAKTRIYPLRLLEQQVEQCQSVLRKRVLYFLPRWACTLLLFSEESSDTHFIFLLWDFKFVNKGLLKTLQKYINTQWLPEASAHYWKDRYCLRLGTFSKQWSLIKRPGTIYCINSFLGTSHAFANCWSYCHSVFPVK